MTSEQLRVFIAEDDELILMVLEDILDELGCKVVGTAASVKGALSLIDSEPFDVAIVDVKLNDGSVEPFADELAKRRIPFALATGFASQDLIARYRGCPVLHKPYMMDDVRKALAKLPAPVAETAASGA
ncbi:MAG: response regulator [Hyphomicrobiaceae bacterium]|nr:response regulator [Hyphomicrobiaceae bacterium]